MNALFARLDVEEVDLVGNSRGGLIGMMLAAQPGMPICRLVLNDIGPFIPGTALRPLGYKSPVEFERSARGALKPVSP